MNRGITSAPMNWAIDYGQNRQGEIMGNAIGNTGGMLGNAIMQYAQDKRKREEKKAKEEAAVRFILASGAGKNIGITDEKSAKQAVSGIGVENIQNLIQIQQREQQMQQAKAQADAETARLNAENQRLKLERETLGKFVSEATTPRVQLPSANAVGAAFNTEGARIPQATMQAPDPLAAFSRNAQNMNPQAGLSALNQIIDSRGKPAPTPQSFNVGGRTIHTFNGQVIPDAKTKGPQSQEGKMAADIELYEKAGNKEAADALRAALRKQGAPTKGMKITGPDGSIIEIGGSGDLTPGDQSAQAIRQASLQRVLGEAEQLRSMIRPQDLGIKGNVMELFTAYGSQLGLKGDDAVVRNRTMIRQFREGALRIMSDEKGAFSNKDRAAIEQLLPSDKMDESPETFVQKMDAVNMVLGGRSKALAASFGNDSIFNLPEDQLGRLYQEGKLSDTEVRAVLRYKSGKLR